MAPGMSQESGQHHMANCNKSFKEVTGPALGIHKKR